MNEEEVADAGCDRQSQPLDFRGQPRQPAVVVRNGTFNETAIGNSRCPRSDGRRTDIEGTANTVQYVCDVGWTVGPAEAQRRQAMYLRKRAGHDHIVGSRYELDT